MSNITETLTMRASVAQIREDLDELFTYHDSLSDEVFHGLVERVQQHLAHIENKADNTETLRLEVPTETDTVIRTSVPQEES